MSTSTLDIQNDYEKIAITRKELKTLYNNILKSMVLKLNLHLPTTHNDPIKNEVYSKVETCLLNSFQNLLCSLLVDGEDRRNEPIRELLSVNDKDDEVEPFDVELDNELRTILTEYDDVTVELSELKRSLSKGISEKYQNSVVRIDDEVTRIIRLIDENVGQREKEGVIDDALAKLGDVDIDRMNEEYFKYLQTVNQLSEEVPLLRRDVGAYSKSVDFLKEREMKLQSDGQNRHR
ncbi:Kinetochore protein Mis14 like family protein [Candida parapsilosis]|uniref:Uncharacterized protein n=2 Tax=Candida parapsilosis TaxID=5480 RepID=G8BAC4_CANPC|nr:uncharacterized protein CPAR2_805460 [Candida parapsilosis]KAF6051895.1 Kinetochore protein Mis14 like family protein [Candida parapsilosis]KAF6052608.1 Kinetochore protein Mis14 like family protein [Candida parapsilosis]KAF6053697.1 Kinetochore protein Mis14 like family protein [Candida parapsilosis]KAF6064384.1 Kinetochore protein Mis14 like family protein [Candida parapsilosis]KAI5905812.1 Kinetochore-associated protein NSL1 [Candida parapsilosis]